jgi:hypothetical protein
MQLVSSQSILAVYRKAVPDLLQLGPVQLDVSNVL